jgi:hypothetical protein
VRVTRLATASELELEAARPPRWYHDGALRVGPRGPWPAFMLNVACKFELGLSLAFEPFCLLLNPPTRDAPVLKPFHCQRHSAQLRLRRRPRRRVRPRHVCASAPFGTDGPILRAP